MRRTRNPGLLGTLVLAVVGLEACGGGESTPSSAPSSSTVQSVDVRTETLIDTSRATEGLADEAAKTSRTLETAIYVPGGRTARSTTALPLVVFAHGSGGNPEFYRVLLEAWAARGYVVAAPRLPADHDDQPGDVSFVITELLRLSSATTGPYAGLVDANRIGVAGHSAGGAAVLGVTFNTCCVDRRIRAGVVMAGVMPPVSGGTYFAGINTPLLVVHGVADPSVPFAEGRRVFNDAPPPKMMLSVPASDVPSADHARPYVGTENRPAPDTRVVVDTTVGFFDRYLRDDREAVGRIRKAVDAEVTFRLEVVDS
ncbi:MAG TPA: alpha/beta fold hydrolase [Acidimicrobiales bacterium]|nr:alpha/beta fold hydrolase [Acidimicrobiales bacterium]